MSFRQLRGLRVQLLLWTILPFAVVLIGVSLAGIARHRQAMTQLVEDRNRALTVAEANRLSRELNQRIAALGSSAGSLSGDGASTELARADPELGAAFPLGLWLFDGLGQPIVGTQAATDWSASAEARVLASRTAATGRAQTEVRYGDGSRPLLLVAAPAPGGRVLEGALEVESLSLVQSDAWRESATAGAVFLFDSTGRPLLRGSLPRPAIDETSLADLPPPPAEGAGKALIRAPAGQEWLVTYARVQPIGWTLMTAEDVRAVGSMGTSVVETLPLLLLFVALVALMAVSFGVANVVRPLQELDRRAARVAWGDFDAVKQPIGGVQEVDDLRNTLAQMADRIRAYQAGMHDYVGAISEAQEEERMRLAREIHDDTVQALIALKQRAQMARKSITSQPERATARLVEIEALVDEQLAALRRMIADLRPIYLEDLGLVTALEMLADQSQGRQQATVHVEVQGEAVRLFPGLELAAFRIVQQALDNVTSHANATEAWVNAQFAPGALTLTVRDDGCGFDPPEQPADLARDGHFGLMGMHERAMLYGGRLTITSALGQGTTIEVSLPTR